MVGGRATAFHGGIRPEHPSLLSDEAGGTPARHRQARDEVVRRYRPHPLSGPRRYWGAECDEDDATPTLLRARDRACKRNDRSAHAACADGATASAVSEGGVPLLPGHRRSGDRHAVPVVGGPPGDDGAAGPPRRLAAACSGDRLRAKDAVEGASGNRATEAGGRRRPDVGARHTTGAARG